MVYTWVNGSDPHHLRRLAAARSKLADRQVDDEPGRFRDYDVLRFSMRSVESFFPEARLIHLVIADEESPPVWLTPTHDRIRLVRHSHIMPRSALPTFNSNAIETNLHRIPGLAECFMYLNDDMLFGRMQSSREHHWDERRGVQLVHFGPWIAPMLDRTENNEWHRAIARSNSELDRQFGVAARHYPLHGCYFFHTAIFAAMRRDFDEAFDKTLHARFRSEQDMVVSFVYPHYAIRKYGA